jgi:dipeptidyl aminopeptidase/acylaminoacyl peptidase
LPPICRGAPYNRDAVPPPVGADDLFRFRWIDHVRLSGDGERVAYQLSWPDAESRQTKSRIVVRRLLDQEPVDVTAGPRRDHSPEWSPDDRSIVFVSRRGAADQVFVLDLAAGGDPQQVSTVPDGAAGPLWSPDGRHIAFIGVVLGDPDAVVDDPRPPESKEQGRRSPVVRLARRLDYKHDGQGFVDGRYHHLFVVPVSGGEATQLTSGAWDVAGFDWSPDSSKLVVAGNAEPNSDLQREVNLYSVDLAGNREKLTTGLYLNSPSWSPRGDLIAFVAPNGLDAGLIERLWIVPAGGGTARCLTLSLDQSVGDSLITDMRGGHGGIRLRWSKDGDRIFFLSSGPGVTALYSCDLDGNLWPEAGGPRRIFDFDVTAGVFALCASDASNPGELHIVMQGAEARLTDLNPWLRQRYIAQPERHQFTAPDGWVIEGWLLKPENFDPSRLHPLVLQIHGGPHGQYGWSFFHELQMLAGMGYLVLYTNPRGSDGYGERFRREVVRDWGGKDYIDLMSSVDQIVERTGAVDTSRLGIAGGSYGGYMTNWAIGQTDRFAAAVSMRSISNLVSEYAQHDIVIWGALELGPPPWPDLDELWRRSPIRYVQNIKTPLLLTCGEMDLRCAISQSEELFGAMRLLGKTVELVRFPEESHDLSRSGRPDRRVERLRRIGGWFERFLGTSASDRPAEAETMVLGVQDQAAVIAVEEPIMPMGVTEAASIDSEAESEAIVLAPAVEPFELTPEPDLPEEAPALVEPEPIAEAQPVAQDEAAPVEAPPGETGQAETAQEETAPVGDVEETLPPAAEVVAEQEPAPVPDWQATVPPAAETAAAPFDEWQSTVPPAPETEAAPAHEWQATVQPEAQEVPAAEAEIPPGHEWLAAVPPVADAVEAEAEAAPVPEWQPTVSPAVDDAVPVFPEPEPLHPEPVEPEPKPVAIATEPEVAEPPQPEPEPAPAEVAAAAPADPAPPAPNRVAETILAWPHGTPPDAATNGSPSQSEFSEEATSIIPAWQPSDVSESKQTVSLHALPPEVIAAGQGYPAKLTFESGPFAGRIVALPNQMVTVGRAPDNDIVVSDPATSGRHGRIEVRGTAFWISDLGSTNGTLVNGEPVIEKQLTHGDLIAMGQNTIRFTLEA